VPSKRGLRRVEPSRPGPRRRCRRGKLTCEGKPTVASRSTNPGHPGLPGPSRRTSPPAETQPFNWSSSSTPSGSTGTQFLIVPRPVILNSLTWASFSASSLCSGPSRTSSESFQAPTSMLALRRKPMPPNIFFDLLTQGQSSADALGQGFAEGHRCPQTAFFVGRPAGILSGRADRGCSLTTATGSWP
jgi:hypothetical protein